MENTTDESQLETAASPSQDRLLTSWLLSTICSSVLPSFTDAYTSCDVWNTTTSLFAADSGAKQSRIRHELHSLKKGNLSITDYVARISNLSALLASSGSRISKEEKVQILLAGLPSEYESIVSSASISTGIPSFRRLVDGLLECENRLTHSVPDIVHANLVEGESSQRFEAFFGRGGRTSSRGRGQSFRSRLQCQICTRFGHDAQRCYYRYSQSEAPPPSPYVPSSPPGYYDSGADHYGLSGNSTFQHTKFPHGGPQGCHYHAHVTSNFQPDNVQHGGPRGNNFYGHMRSTRPPRPNASRPSPYGPNFGPQNVEDSYFPGPPNPRPSVRGPSNDRPTTNNVQIGSVPRSTKPKARVYMGSDPYIGMPRVGDLHASDYSDYSGSQANTSQYESADGTDGSYIPVPVGTTSWYPDSGANNHVCRDPFALHHATPYSGRRDEGSFDEGPHS